MTEDPSGEGSADPRGTSSISMNSSWMLGSRLMVAVIQWLTTLLIIRHLSLDQFGAFSLIFGILGMLSMVTDMGLGRIAVSMLIDDAEQRPRTAGSYILLRTSLGVLGYALAVGIVAVGGYGTITIQAAAVAAFTVVFDTIASAYSVIYQVSERMAIPSIGTVLGAGSQMLVVSILITGDAGLVQFMIPAVVASAVNMTVRIVGVHRIMRPRFIVDLGLWGHLLKEAIPISVGNAMTTLYYRIDVIMLSQLATLAAVATYSVAYKFVDIVNMIPWAISTAALPVLVRYWPQDPKGFDRVVLQVCRLLAAIGGLISAGFIALAQDVVPLLYGQEYANAANAAKVVVVSQCVSFAAAAALLILIAAGNHRRFPWIATGGLAFNVGVNFVMIPRYSYMGAAWTTLATDALMGVAMWWEVYRTKVMSLRQLVPLWPIALATVAAATAGLALNSVLWWPLVGVAVVLTFVALLLSLRGLGSGGLRDIVRLGQ